MVIKREVAYGIVRGMSEFWNCEELQDFTVTVGETKFGCHKLLLAACSGFFRGLLRSGMKETESNCATLKCVSSETFLLILETIYTGRGVLTNDNVIDIWRAAHQLQVTFMITECEMFVLSSLSLDNYVQYFHYGRLLSSKVVTDTVWNFILRHCNSFFKTSYFLDLPFCDVLNLTKSQELATSSEDDVLRAILNWIEYKPDKEQHNETNDCPVPKEAIPSIEISEENSAGQLSNDCTTGLEHKDSKTDDHNLVLCENNMHGDKMGRRKDTVTDSDSREQYLFDLVSNTRTCLASHECLKMLLNHPLVSENKQNRDIATTAIFYQLQVYKRSGQWPRGATHRNNSSQGNLAIQYRKDKKQFKVFSFSSKNWNDCKCQNMSNNEIIIRLVTVANSLYCLYVDDTGNAQQNYNMLIFCLTQTDFKWSQITSLALKSNAFSVVTVNEFMYIVQRKNFWKLNPSSPTIVQLPDLPDDQSINHLTVYDQKILAFYAVSLEGGVDETAVLSFDIPNNTWTRLNNIEGPANGITSFKGDHSTYMLQSNGDLWKLVKPQSDVVDFEFVVKLWRCDWPLHGAVIFLDELYLYGVKSETIKDDPQLLKSVDGLFKQIKYLQSLESECTKSMFVPFIAGRNIIVEI